MLIIYFRLSANRDRVLTAIPEFVYVNFSSSTESLDSGLDWTVIILDLMS